MDSPKSTAPEYVKSPPAAECICLSNADCAFAFPRNLAQDTICGCMKNDMELKWEFVPAAPIADCPAFVKGNSVFYKNAETGEILFELLEPGEERILVRGGRGGLGNNNFKSATNQTPRYSQPGEPGEEGWYILELKVLADVGLVGFPNAGKSTLLAAVSAAKPKIADYPFTTMEPNLGIVSYYDDKSFVMADIPGIIEGAHLGKGIGLRFLRHIERNSVLLFLIPADSPDPSREYEILLGELREYNPELLVKGRILAISKSDMLDEKAKGEIEDRLPQNVRHIFFSSLTGDNIRQLKDMLWDLLHENNG